MTYCMRQFLTSFFQIALVEDDVDTYRTKQKEAEHREEVMVAEKLVKKIDEAVKGYLKRHEDRKDEVKAFVTKYAKRGDYLKITDPALAGYFWWTSLCLSDGRPEGRSRPESACGRARLNITNYMVELYLFLWYPVSEGGMRCAD